MDYANIFKKPNYLLVMALVLVSSLLYFTLKYEKIIEHNIFKVATNDLFEITRNHANFIQRNLDLNKSYVTQLQNDEALRKNFEQSLENLTTQNIKYTYLLYKDPHNVFRFLLDGSKEGEKSFLNQKFDVGNENWYEIYQTKKPVVIKHTVLQSLFITYLVPIIQNDEVSMILVVDFSIKTIAEINNIMTTIKVGLTIMLGALGILFLLVLFHYVRYKKMEKLSYIDKLTSVYNRNYLQKIQETIKLQEYALAVLDIDHFKNINDTYGHDVGDIVLKAFGEIVLNTIRTSEDIVIRYGGEEFLVLLKRSSLESEAPLRAVSRINENIKKHKIYRNENDYISITVSIGVNQFPEKYKSFVDAFKEADTLLYEAKQDGRDRIKIG